MMLDWIFSDSLGIIDARVETGRMLGFVQGMMYLAIIFFGIQFVIDTILYCFGAAMDPLAKAQNVIMIVGLGFLMYFYVLRKQLIVEMQEEERKNAQKSV